MKTSISDDRKYKTVGRNIDKKDGWQRLRGEPVFSADISPEKPLVLRVLRSEKAHAEFEAVDCGAALALPGVVRVFTASDVPVRNLMGIINKDQPLLMPDRVRSLGDAVALVAAESEEAAEAALQAIRVRYCELPAVFDPEQALSEDSPRVQAGGNLLDRRVIKRGDVEAGFAASDLVLEQTYRTSHIEHCFLEPDAGYGFVDRDGTLVIYASTQNPHYDRSEVSGILGLAKERVRIIQAATGGGFGSKLDVNCQGFIGLALYHLQRPVRLVYTREESFLATAKRHPLTITIKSGADKSGRLRAARVRIVCDTGAYGSYGIAVVSRAAVHALGPYALDNVDIESLGVYTNNPFCGAMRGFGAPQAAFAAESQMDLLARELGLDPLEIRKINALRNGSTTVTGQKLEAGVGYLECLEAVEPYYREAKREWLKISRPAHKKPGIGLGGMFYGIGNTGTKNPSTARVEMDRSGRVTLLTGCADIGQGSTTVLAQILAESLDLDHESIQLVVADTGRTSSAGATSASRQTYISGNAVKAAAQKLTQRLLSLAAEHLQAAETDLALEGGWVRHLKDSARQVSVASLAALAHDQGLDLAGEGRFDPATTALDPETGQGVPYAAYAFACQLALISVDVLTGEVEVEKVVAAHDVGRAVHPENVNGQICGGVAMGLGFALMEEFEPGKTGSLKDYHIPTCRDMPEVVPIIVESEEPSGPFGAKGVGEPALIPTAPAILNGLASALGKRIYALPASLE
ncbi:MAG: xanthine dehydrogenase family protein molybdopterin-binding subunit, partial [Thermodesulfobacteriota bacterium]